ncbi:hydantoinase/oxoprolinase N-terminal domain-containing protein [Chelatococcus asaccharovorans]|uniref:hydantoinase/oxoprolinase N-terminal domain-containing protein n=1 Tax=Chelatococcus asaccharovorans TaxID=28210 RepID=UPI00224C773E|nr:hydantoinase/oxoprolinase N-terminal domain-containing protein [Chelatococcus asaccharovorans]CAH1652586.1 Hydantoinase/oxoprolinase-like protein [Chelatococcus asaccharovorans]CAH1686291.1 Hydantoinase/oxoprolinase-like protein [Chelatococcus asaccharovorans]
MSSLHAGIDVGGTFADSVSIRSEREVTNLKGPSTPSDPAAAIPERLQKVVGKEDEIRHFSQDTTLAVNPLAQRNVARTGLLVTRGFRDILEIGRRRLSDPNNYSFARAEPSVSRRDVREISERLDAQGDVLEPMDEADGGFR